MTDNSSILDKIITSNQASLMTSFNPRTIVDELIQGLTERERDVIMLRHGLDFKGPKTLEKIGGQFQVTRERIRQIENSALRKIGKAEGLAELLKPAETVFNQVLELHGGIMAEETLLNEIIARSNLSDSDQAHLYFILSQLLNEKLVKVKETDDYHAAWQLPTASWQILEEILGLLFEAFNELGEAVSLEKIMSHLQEKKGEHQLAEHFTEPIINSFLRVSKKLNINPFNEWGLNTWETIALKRISDKVYLVLKKAGQPLHFTEIAAKINELGIDQKTANPATIHNELILDPKYILVGRGIYALREWGYQPGVVADVVAEVLKSAGQPLNKEEIIKRVLEKRLVKRSTIILALMNKERFSRDKEGNYTLKSAQN